MMTSAPQRVLALTLVTGIVLTGEAIGQDSTRKDASLEASEEEFLELIDDEETSANAAEMLSWLRENPIDLNSARRDELLSIPGVTGDDADAILRLRESQGSFGSVDDIRRLPNGEEIVAHIRPYVFAHHADPGTRLAGIPAVVVSSRLSGFLPGTASSSLSETFGSLPKFVSRIALRASEHVKAGFLFEKDGGERIRDGFASGYIAYHGNGALEQVVLGDFCAETGQGLVLWRGVGMGRNGNVADGVRKPSARLLPYHLTDEAHYLRGGACALKGKLWALPVRCLLVLSRTSLAANLNDQGEVTSFYASGLYRTESELEMRNSVHELLTGIHLECHVRGKGAFGLTYYRSTFDRPVSPSSPNVFSGVSSEVAGGDFSFCIAEATIFGECARTAHGATAWIAGVVIPLDSLFKASLAYRDYSEDFRNPHAAGFGVQTNTTNERGFSLGWWVRLPWGLSLKGYADQCKMPTGTFASFLPRMASDFLVQVSLFPTPQLRLSVACRTTRAEIMWSNSSISPGSVKVQESRDKTSARFTAQMEVSSHLAARIRVEHLESRFSCSPQEAKGNMVSHTFCYNARGMDLECGVAFFDADSYDARLYDFEGNVRGCIASPPLSGRGSRWHVVASWGSLPWVRLAGKYGVMLQEKGPVARELAVQVELRF